MQRKWGETRLIVWNVLLLLLLTAVTVNEVVEVLLLLSKARDPGLLKRLPGISLQRGGQCVLLLLRS